MEEMNAELVASQAHENLATLGLVFLIDGLEISDANWQELFKLSQRVIESLSYTRPEEPTSLWLHIDSVYEAPNAAGYISASRPVHPSYWIPKAKYDGWIALEHFLYGLRPRKRDVF